MNNNNRNTSTYVTPKPWRIAANVFLIIIGTCFLLASIAYFSTGVQLSNSGSDNAGFLSTIIIFMATVMIIEGISLLFFGIILCTKTYSGAKHKSLLLITLMILLGAIVLTNILNLIWG